MWVNWLDGELKKRINEFEFKETITLDFSSNKQVFLKWIDEAKKDLPDFVLDSIWYDATDVVDLIHWVKKWFGDSS